MFHNRLDGVALAHDAPVSRGVGHVHSQQRELAASAVGDQPLQGVGLNQRHVAVQNQRDAVIWQRGHGLLHRMPGAELRLLACEFHLEI